MWTTGLCSSAYIMKLLDSRKCIDFEVSFQIGITCKRFHIFGGKVNWFICFILLFCLLDSTMQLLIKKPGVCNMDFVTQLVYYYSQIDNQHMFYRNRLDLIISLQMGHLMQLCGSLGNMGTLIQHRKTLTKCLLNTDVVSRNVYI